MLRLLTCMRGHFWESVEVVACPQCGALPDSLPLLDLAEGEPPPAPVVEPPPEPVDGDRLAITGYEVVEYLGKGPTGLRLYKAKQIIPGRHVLLEVVLAREDSSQHAWSSLRSQAAALARLAHPGIIGLLDAGERDRQVFYNVLEWPTGPTLAQMVSQKQLPTGQVVRLVETLARIIDHAHGLGVVHRSLRPRAVILSPTSLPASLPNRDNPPGPTCWLRSTACLPRIADFGLVRRPIEGEPVDLELYGDEVGFLSPEQAWGRSRDFGPATDVWGLGAILHFLLTGKPPYQGSKPHEVLDAIQAGDPLRARGVSADLSAILSKALARSPSRRYATAGELADDLRRLSLHLPLECRPPTAGYRFGKWMRRNPALGAIVLLAGLAVLGTAGGFIYGATGADLARRAADRAGTDLRTAEARLASANLELYQLRGRLRFDTYRMIINRTAAALARGDFNAARADLDRTDMADRGVEWTILREQTAGRVKAVLPAYANNINEAVLDSTGRFAAVASKGDRFGQGTDGKVVVWHIPSKTESLSRNGPQTIQAVAFSPSSDTVAAVGGDQRGGVIKAWSLAEGARRGDMLYDQRVTARPLTGLAYFPDGQTVAAVASSREVVVLNSLGVPVGGRFGGKLDRGGSTQVACSLDSRFLATATTGDTEIRIWDLGAQRHLRPLPAGSSVTCLASLPASSPLFAYGAVDRFIRFYNVMGENRVRSLAEPLDARPVRLAFSADGKRLAVACDNGTIQFLAEVGDQWNLLLRISADGSRGLSFSASGKSLLVAGTKEVVILGVAGN